MNHTLHSTPTLSHEINNYLSVIYSQLQHIESIYKYLSKDEQWLQMKKDFDSVFAFLADTMNMELFQCAATIEGVNLSSFLKRLYQSWNPRLSDYQILFSIPDEIEQVELAAGKQQLDHIFHNLLTNSFEAICQKSVYGKFQDSITIETELLSKTLEVRIKDSGCGMTGQQLSHVLNPGITLKQDGHGLGLPLVLELMETIHGEFHITSSPGRGTTAFLSFPLL